MFFDWRKLEYVCKIRRNVCFEKVNQKIYKAFFRLEG